MVQKFDAADYLDSPEAVAAYLTEALATDDPSFIRTAFDTVARAKGLETTHQGDLADGRARPDFEMIRKALNAFGVRLVVEPVEAA